MKNTDEIIKKNININIKNLNKLKNNKFIKKINEIVELCLATLKNNNKIIFCGMEVLLQIVNTYAQN